MISIVSMRLRDAPIGELLPLTLPEKPAEFTPLGTITPRKRSFMRICLEQTPRYDWPCVLARDGVTTVGWALAHYPDIHPVTNDVLAMVFVAEDWRRQGIGRQLIQQITRDARREWPGIRRFWMGPGNGASEAFARACADILEGRRA